MVVIVTKRCPYCKNEISVEVTRFSFRKSIYKKEKNFKS